MVTRASQKCFSFSTKTAIIQIDNFLIPPFLIPDFATLSITKGESWDSLYADAAEGLEVLETVDEAVAWANELIERIDTAN